MRKLASIQIIDAITPIQGKDRIALATVLGWRVIINKADYQVGDKCVYCQIDSVMPNREEFSFLKSPRIKTLKMAGVISQGICFPLSILSFVGSSADPQNWNVGDDVTNILGIHQYEPDMDNDKDVSEKNRKDKNPLMRFAWYRKLFGKKPKSGFPSFISKTDETRIQNAPWLLSDKDEYIATEKVDGCSGTFALVQHRFLFFRWYEYIVCSRNMRLHEKDASIYWQVSDKYHIEAALRNMIGNREWIAIQGECCGPKIQGNKYGFDEPRLFAFNLISSDHGRMGSVQAMNLLATKGIDFVPIVDTKFVLPTTAQKMLKLAHGDSKLGNTIREGLVVRSKDGKQSFKAVDPLFLLKYE